MMKLATLSSRTADGEVVIYLKQGAKFVRGIHQTFVVPLQERVPIPAFMTDVEVGPRSSIVRPPPECLDRDIGVAHEYLTDNIDAVRCGS